MAEPITPIEAVVKYLQERIDKDKQYKSLSEHLNIKSGQIGISGRDESYPAVPDYVGGELSVLRSSPLPNELIDRFSQMKKNCLMGLFPESERVWLTIDNDIFVWNYEDGSDLAYYDGLKDTIISVGFVKPKLNVFRPDIHYLLVLATHSDVVILGVNLRTCAQSGPVNYQTMHLLPEPLMCVPTLNQTVNCVAGTEDGRIFLGTCDASLLEIQYGVKSSWLNLSFLGNKMSMSCVLVNHSTSTFASFLPRILTAGLKDEETIIEIVNDPHRHLLYSLTNKSTLTVYHLGSTQSPNPSAPISREVTVTESALVNRVCRVLKSYDVSQLGKVIHLVVLPPTSGVVDLLHIMTVNQAGIRYYFGQRLDLVHIRVPPVSNDMPKIGQVRLAAESRGTVLLLSSCGEDSDVLCCLSPDPFPWLTNLTESCRISWPPSRAWIMQPIGNNEEHSLSRLESKMIKGSRNQFISGVNKGSPPIVITQHIDTVRRFLLVSAQGVVHLELPSPLQMLAHLLQSSDSPDSIPVHKWFFHYGAEEAVYAALVLASDGQNEELSKLAKQAIFFYSTVASETYAVNQSQNQTTMHQQKDASLSAAAWIHRGLALYAARILRPIWDVSMVTEQIVKEKEIFFVSRYDTEELSWFLHHLTHLQGFIREHLSQLRTSPAVVQSTATTYLHPVGGVFPVRLDITDDLMDFLKVMIEIMGLWRLMAEHPFYLIARRLNQDQQKLLIETSVKRLLGVPGRQMLAGLIAALLDHYLADGASIEAISAKLRSVCPSLFGNEDALCAKANELLEMLVSRVSPDQRMSDEERRLILTDAVQIYQSVGPQIDLGVVLPRLKAAGCYWGMVKLCLSVAVKRDPENRSITYMKEGITPHSDMEKAPIEGRYDAYRRLLETLDTLLEMCKSSQRYLLSGHTTKSPLPRVPGDQRSDAASAISTLSKVEANPAVSLNAGDSFLIDSSAKSQLHTQLEEIFLSSNDILVHYEVLGWLLTNSLKKEILASNSPHLESYLRNRLRQCGEDVELRELLWRHYEREEKRLEAARVLEHLAVMYCESVKLNHRIDYLTRAIVCVKATPGFQNEGDYLHDLEDKLEIAYLQRQVIEELNSCYKLASQEVETARVQLEHQLFNVSALYTEYAERFRLLISKLSLLRASGVQDMGIVSALWEEVLDREMAMYQGNADREISEEVLRDSLCRLMGKFKSTPTYFPLEIIVTRIEKHAFENDFSKEWGVSCFRAMKIEIPNLIYAYDKVVKCKDNICQEKAFKKHLYDIIYSLCSKFMEHSGTIHPRYRQMTCTHIADLLTSYVLEFESTGDRSLCAITQKMKVLKNELERLTG